MKDGIKLDGFTYDVEVIKDGRVVAAQRVRNIIPQEGLTHVASMLLASGATPISWYVGVFEGNYVPTSATVAADLPSTAGECTSYSEATRPAWSAAHDSGDNTLAMATPAEFTLNADKTIYGAFLASSSTKGGGSGKLLSIARFSSPFVLTSGSVLRVRPILSILTAQLG